MARTTTFAPFIAAAKPHSCFPLPALLLAAFGAGLIVFSFTRVLWLSLGLMVVTGLGFMVQMAVSNTVLQTIVDEDKRGRMMSFYTILLWAPRRFGSLLAGTKV